VSFHLLVEGAENLIALVYRVIILVFTSEAFLEWVRDNTTLGGSAFNPYLSFLFFAL
jgi:hypothetical protein